RPHGTHACYVHGPSGVARGQGCRTGPDGTRCQPCRDANAAYEKARATRTEPPYVDANEVREHIAWLSANGLGLKTLATRSVISHGALWKIVYGQPSAGRPPTRRVRPATRDAVLAIRPADGAPGARINARTTWHHVDTLITRGWSKAAIGKAIGQTGGSLQL